jgi:hypothetical protein
MSLLLARLRRSALAQRGYCGIEQTDRTRDEFQNSDKDFHSAKHCFCLWDGSLADEHSPAAFGPSLPDISEFSGV